MSEPQPPLNFRSPKPHSDGRNPLRAVVGFILGLPCGVALVIISGFFMYSAAEPGHSPSTPTEYLPGVIFYATLGVCALGGAVYFAIRSNRRMFLAGLLLGAALMSLVEGSCFHSFTPI